MHSPLRILVLLLLTVLRLGLPAQVVHAGPVDAKDPCGRPCCSLGSADTCCCGASGPVRPSEPGCPCELERETPLLPPLPPAPGDRPTAGGPALPGCAALGCGSVPRGAQGRLRIMGRRPLAVAGRPLFRLYAVDRL